LNTGFSGKTQPIPATIKKIKVSHFGAVANIVPIVAAPQIQNAKKSKTAMLATSLRCDWGMNCNFLDAATVWPLAVRA
jgi:hypothetical protein